MWPPSPTRTPSSSNGVPGSPSRGRKLEASRRHAVHWRLDARAVQAHRSSARAIYAARTLTKGTLVTLSGLLQVATDDPDLRQALDQALQLPALGGDLIAPASLRPLLVAALAGAVSAADSTRPPVTLAVTATAHAAG